MAIKSRSIHTREKKDRDALDMVGNNSHGWILNRDVTRSNWYFANFKISILYRIG